jgi:hypothetical protein
MTRDKTWIGSAAIAGVVLVTALGACNTEPPDPEAPDPDVVLLSPREQLIRLSVDLRGVHPSEEELVAIESNPMLYEDYVDRYLGDERFLDRVAELFNLSYLTRTGDPWFDPAEAGLGALSDERVADSVNDEPLALIRYIVENDLPFSEVVTADYVIADEVVAAMWDLDYPVGATGWQPSSYRDGRAHAGVLSMTSLWQRYPSAGVNANRHRANQISRILLCDDYLSRPVAFSRSQIDALTGADPNDVIAQTEVCQSCHSTLDPLAAHFYGFWWEIDGGLEDQTTYRPEDEPLWRDNSGRSPAYYGRPTAGLVELGQEIASDERFVSCAVKTVYDGLSQRTTDDADWTELQAHQDAFVASELSIRELVRSIVVEPGYRARAFDDVDREERVPTVKTVSPAQLASVIEGITGYRWTFGGRDGLVRDDIGLVVLGGGIDSELVTVPSYDPSVGIVLIQERLAQAAAHAVAESDLDPNRTEPALLLRYVTIDDTPQSAAPAFDAQIRALYLEVTGIPLPDTATEPARLTALWDQLYSVDASPVSAWSGVLSVILRDPRVIFY